MKRKTILILLFSIVFLLISTLIFLLLIEFKIIGNISETDSPNIPQDLKFMDSDIPSTPNDDNQDENNLYNFNIEEDSDICIKRILDSEVDVEEYLNEEIYLNINYVEDTCGFVPVDEDDYSKKIKLGDIELGSSVKRVVYKYFPSASSIEQKVYIKLEDDIYLNSHGLGDGNGFKLSEDSNYLLIEGSQWYVVDTNTLKIETVDVLEDGKKETNFLGNSPIWSNGYLLFATVNGKVFATFKDDDRDYEIKYSIYNPKTRDIITIEGEDSPDFRFCPAACPSQIYIHGSWGIIEDYILYYTTYKQYNWDSSEDSPSKYGIKFVDIESKKVLYEKILEEYTYPIEDLRHLEHYLCEIEIDQKSLKWINNTPSFRYRFKYPVDEGSDTAWTDWKTL
jgi:hypothetical protein